MNNMRKIQRALCILEHMVLRELFFENPPAFMSDIDKDPQMCYGALHEIMISFDLEDPFTADQFERISLNMDRIRLTKLAFPEPDMAPNCYMIFMAYDPSSGLSAYFTIEKSSDSDHPQPVIARWDEDGQYYRCGHCPCDDTQILDQVIAIFQALQEDTTAPETVTPLLSSLLTS